MYCGTHPSADLWRQSILQRKIGREAAKPQIIQTHFDYLAPCRDLSYLSNKARPMRRLRHEPCDIPPHLDKNRRPVRTVSPF